jgi:hypothetical protein
MQHQCAGRKRVSVVGLCKLPYFRDQIMDPHDQSMGRLSARLSWFGSPTVSSRVHHTASNTQKPRHSTQRMSVDSNDSAPDEQQGSEPEAMIKKLKQMFQWLQRCFDALDVDKVGTIDVPRIAPSLMAGLTEAGLPHLWLSFLAAVENREKVEGDEFTAIALSWIGIDAESEGHLYPGPDPLQFMTCSPQCSQCQYLSFVDIRGPHIPGAKQIVPL